MRDRAGEIEARLARVQGERLRPALHTTIAPLRMETCCAARSDRARYLSAGRLRRQWLPGRI